MSSINRNRQIIKNNYLVIITSKIIYDYIPRKRAVTTYKPLKYPLQPIKRI